MSDELKPCRVCGHPGKYMGSIDVLKYGTGRAQLFRHVVECTNPDEEWPCCEECHGKTKEDAFRAWNRRAPAPEAEALAEAARIHGCTCPRSWPRAGNHHESCLVAVVAAYRAIYPKEDK